MEKQKNLEESLIVCKCCGRTFNSYAGLGIHLRKNNITTKQYYDTHIKKFGEGICKMCGNPTRFNSIPRGYSRYCSNKCINNDPAVKKKMADSARNTFLEKYGVENISQLDEIKKKKEHTFQKKYGVSNVFQLPEVIEKSHTKRSSRCTKRNKKEIINGKVWCREYFSN